MTGFRSVSILTVAFSGFSRKINFAHANYFWTNTPSFYGAEKKSLTFFPFNALYYFSWASLCKFTRASEFLF